MVGELSTKKRGIARCQRKNAPSDPLPYLSSNSYINRNIENTDPAYEGKL